MKHKRLAMLTLPAAALLAFAASVPEAAAQDQFTFTANLDANVLHEDVAQVGFTCRVCNVANCGDSFGNPNTVIGLSMLKFPIDDETSFNQPVTLGVNVFQGENPEAVQGWWCSLQLSDVAGFEQLPHPGAGRCIADDPQGAGQPFFIRHAVPARAVLRGSF